MMKIINMKKNEIAFVIPASENPDILLIRDSDGKHIQLTIQGRIKSEDGYFYIVGITQDDEEMTLRIKNDHVEQIIE